MEKYGQYRDKGTVPDELPYGIAGMFSMLITPTTGSGIAPFFPVSNGGGNAPWLFPWRVVRFVLHHPDNSIANMSSVPVLPADTFPDLLWFHLVRLHPMDYPWHSPP